MLATRQIRHIADFGSELEAFRSRCQILGDAFAGMGLLFSIVAALVAVVGMGLGSPLFAASAAFALIAAAAFALAARKLAQARRELPSIRPPVAREADHVRAAERWRRAA